MNVNLFSLEIFGAKQLGSNVFITGPGRLEEYGSVGEAIEQLFGIPKDQQVSGAQKQGQAPAQTLAISSLTAGPQAKLQKLPDGQEASLGGVTYVKQGGNLVPK